jgi:hypothetical protein
LLAECDYPYAHGLLHLQFFQCRLRTEKKEPAAPFRWVKRQCLGDYPFPPANEALLKMLATPRAEDGRTLD